MGSRTTNNQSCSGEVEMASYSDLICRSSIICSVVKVRFGFVAQKHVLLKAALYVESVYLGHVHIAVHSLLKSIISKEDPR